MGLLRVVGRVAALFLFTLLCVPLHLATRLTTGGSRWPRRYLAGAGRIVGLRVRVTGEPLRRDVFFVANHVSWMDILALGGTGGCAFVAMAELGRWPAIGWLAAQNNTILVDRSQRGQVHGQIAMIRRAMAGHQPIALFPEGTTGDGLELLPFKPSLFAVLLPPPRAIRIQPVLLDYGTAAPDIAWTGDEPAGRNVVRLLARKGRVDLTLHFLDSFDPGDHPDRKSLSGGTRAALERAMRAFPAGGGTV